jgi:hypothetical protein
VNGTTKHWHSTGWQGATYCYCDEHLKECRRRSPAPMPKLRRADDCKTECVECVLECTGRHPIADAAFGNAENGSSR